VFRPPNGIAGGVSPKNSIEGTLHKNVTAEEVSRRINFMKSKTRLSSFWKISKDFKRFQKIWFKLQNRKPFTQTETALMSWI
jgi:hypothetical protein